MLLKIKAFSIKVKILLGVVAAALVTGAGIGIAATVDKPVLEVEEAGAEIEVETIEMLKAQWPKNFAYDKYIEPEFVDDENRDNNAFNVADFGEQGSNGWFYRYGDAEEPTSSKQILGFDGEKYFQSGIDGLEIKKDFYHTGAENAAILEWRAAKQGKVNLMLAYVKNVNGDKNPNYPDGVYVNIYKGDELLESHQVEIKVDKETLLETNIDNLAVEDNESIYVVVDGNQNNAYDGGLLYVAIVDTESASNTVKKDAARENNNADYIEDFGAQGSNGWYYMYGKHVKDSKLVSSKTENGYINYTSPSLQIGEQFIHPAINDNAIIAWEPKTDGEVEIRGTYTKFEQNDGNPDWPDGVTVQIFLNQQKLFEEKVSAPDKGTNKISFRQPELSVTSKDKIYFVVDANKNASYDGGCFDIRILDRTGMKNEDAVMIDESEIRQNMASVKDDFGAQGENGWFYQEGYKEQPFGAYNITEYVEDDKYIDDKGLEIKRDYVSTGKNGGSAVIKWKVAQDGVIGIETSYTKLKNEDANPSWPDGTDVLLYHNETLLGKQEFAADVSEEITKELNVDSLTVNKDDYITMVIDGKENNAYDGGKYDFSIFSLSGLVGQTEDDIKIEKDDSRTNDACIKDDFGKQGNNGWFFQYGYYTDPFCAVNVENFVEGDRHITKDGIEIKRDFIMPSTKGKSANVKWKVAKDGLIDIFVDYTKLKNEDANPSWPDGTIVTLMHNNTVLKSESFEPDTAKEVTKALNVEKLKVKKGEYITLLVNGKENTAYDGGLYSFIIEDATSDNVKKKNDSETNHANLEADFGEQGSNGWYYLEGRTIERAKVLTLKTEDNEGYLSRRESGLELKKNFVQPGPSKDAMYQWVVAQDGKVDVVGNYTKYGHNDANPDWPDGTKVNVYLNDTLLQELNGEVLQGEEKSSSSTLKIKEQKVKKGDIFTFVIDGQKNNAWDGGKLAVQIKPSGGKVKFVSAPDNNANLEADFGEQGNQGWYYGYGNTSAEFELADNNNGEYSSVLQEGLLMKRDGVHPGKEAGAIYRWLAGEDGKIDLKGAYYKAKNESTEDTTPDGVKVEVYKNGVLIKGMSYDVAVSTKKENVQTLKKDELEVKKGDKIDFIITAKKNSSWDYGKLAVQMKPSGGKIKFTSAPDNNANLEADFGEQGNQGWYYGYGNTSAEFELADNNNGEYSCVLQEGLLLKKDGVHPGKETGAIYRWLAGEDGKIDLKGAYYKAKNENPKDTTPDGVKVEVYKNGVLIKGMSYDVAISTEEEIVQQIEKSELDVKKGDKIDFIITAKKNSEWDYGKLAMKIRTSTGDIEYVSAPDNYANLEADFGEQGKEGWYYGTCEWDGSDFVMLPYDAENKRYYNNGKPELKADFVEPGQGLNAAYKWIAGEDGKITITGEYIKYPNAEDKDATGVCLRIYQNQVEKKWVGEGINTGGISSDVKVSFTQKLKVKKGDEIIFAVNPEGNDSYDGGKLSIDISPVTDTVKPEVPETPEGRTNNTNLFKSFGAQGNDGWYYGTCEWDGSDFTMLPYDAENKRYYNDGKPELKADYVEPGQGLNAAYEWVAAEDGKIVITGKYTKYPNAEDKDANGVCLRIFQNETEKKWIGDGINIGGISSDVMVKFTQELDVKKGDEIIFAVNPEGNDSYDGGKLSIDIRPASDEEEQEKPEVPKAPEGRTNNTNLFNSFGAQGNDGWYYGTCEWNGVDFTLLEYDAENKRYYNDGKPELKADYVEPGQGLNAAYKWVAAEDGKIAITGEYIKYPNAADPNATGVCLRIFQNETEKKWIGDGINIGGISSDVTVNFTQELDVKKGDEIIFAVNPEGNDSYDGGKLSINISPASNTGTPEKPGDTGTPEKPGDTETPEVPETPETPEVPEVPEAPEGRTNNTNLFSSFGAQGSDGWYYGTCEWNGANFVPLTYDAENKRYFNNGKPELKADFVEPGQGLNAAYKWIVAEDGKIVITGEYIKYANANDSNADGVCLRIFQNQAEKKWIGDGIKTGGLSSDVTVNFTQELDVRKGDEIMFAVNPEGNDSYDGGKLSINISPASNPETPEQPENPEQPETPEGRTNNTNLFGSFGEQGNDGWYYGTCEWNGANFALLPYDAENKRYFNNGKPELKADFVEPGQGLNAAYKWKAAEDGTIVITGEYIKYANANDSNANGVCLRIFQNQEEKKWIGDGINIGGLTNDVTVNFTQELVVRKDDEIMFAVNPEGDDSYDGGKLSINISPKQ